MQAGEPKQLNIAVLVKQVPRFEVLVPGGRWEALLSTSAIGVSGKFNPVIGVRAAGMVIAINSDPRAPVLGFADLGIVGDWRVVVPRLVSELKAMTAAVLGDDGTF
jgi:hypothetical protein